MPLVILAILFSTIVNVPNVPSKFIFLLLEEIVIALCVSILVSLIIFPTFATIDIENRVHYALLNLEKMHTVIVQSFSQEDEINAQALLTRATIIEEMIREAISPIQMKLTYARFEPSRLLQRIFNFKRRKIFNLTLQGLFSLTLVISSIFFCRTRSIDHIIVSPCSFNAING